MKKRILIIGVVLALILTLVAPAAAFANPPKPSGKAFWASASLVVTDGGQTSLRPAGKGNWLMTTSGEIIQGQFTYSNWQAAQGAYLSVTHDSTVTLYQNGMFYGTSDEDVTVYLNNGQILNGSSKTSIKGQWYWDWDWTYHQWYVACAWVTDAGDFNISDGNTSASGNWNAIFFPATIEGYETLAGPATFSGTYNTHN